MEKQRFCLKSMKMAYILWSTNLALRREQYGAEDQYR